MSAYREMIHLDEAFVPLYNGTVSREAYVASVYEATTKLLLESPHYARCNLPDDLTRQSSLLKALLTVRPPEPIDECLMRHLDLILQFEEGQVVEAVTLPSIRERYVKPGIPGEFTLWRGDITRLRVDAIVNAANNQMLGCFVPNHACIDNAIHSAAGPRLREDCDVIMELQGAPEPTGSAKITRGYHLPSRFVLHTVGPIIPSGSVVTMEQRDLLASCYTSCLTVAAEVKTVRSVAFCGISTGVFGYPKQEAAEFAMQTVTDWVRRHPGRFDAIIFNVFGKEDEEAYEGVIGTK